MPDTNGHSGHDGRVEQHPAIEGDAPLAELVLEDVEAMSDAVGEIRSGKLAGKSMWAAIWILAAPVLIQQLAAAGLGLFDKILAGKLPADIVVPAMDGLGIGSYVGWFIGIAMTGLGIGGQALIARAMGAGRLDEAHQALGQAMSLSVLWGAAVGVVLWTISPLITSWCRLSPEASTYCVQYIRALAVFMPFNGIMMVGSMCLHGAGETTKPALIALAVNVVNVVFSWVLSGADITYNDHTLVNPFSFDLHVEGIALGTAISYFAGALLIIRALRRGVKDLALRGHDLPLRGAMVGRIVRIGVPSFLEGISMWTVNLFILTFIGLAQQTTNAEGLQGAHIIAVQWEALSFLPGFAIGTAAGALAGQYLGAGNAAMARRAVLACTTIAIAVMGGLGVVFVYFGPALTRVISSEPVHLQQVPSLLHICGTMQVFFAITMVVRQGLRGMGDTTWTLIITTVSSYGVRLPMAWLLGIHYGLGLEGIWLALCGEFFVRACLFSARFFQGGWRRLRV